MDPCSAFGPVLLKQKPEYKHPKSPDIVAIGLYVQLYLVYETS